MKCPKCNKDTLDSFGGVEGVEVDFCSECRGIWFDKGEMAFYVETPEDVPDIETALAAGTKTEGKCPRCETELVETYYVPDDILKIDICPSCRGIFLDFGELQWVEEIAARYSSFDIVARTVRELKKKGYAVIGVRSSKF
jgi:Zn-finger nucleic acid-binding protein